MSTVKAQNLQHLYVSALLGMTSFRRETNLQEKRSVIQLRRLTSFVLGLTVNRAGRASHGTCSSSIKIFIEDIRKIFWEYTPSRWDDARKYSVRACHQMKWIVRKKQDVASTSCWWRIVGKRCLQISVCVLI